jgi:hypothetical protein
MLLLVVQIKTVSRFSAIASTPSLISPVGSGLLEQVIHVAKVCSRPSSWRYGSEAWVTDRDGMLVGYLVASS